MSKRAAILLMVALLLIIVTMTLIIWHLSNSMKGPGTAISSAGQPGSELVIATWNIRGYPEKRADAQAWFSRQTGELNAAVLCVQEIATEAKVHQFLQTEGFSTTAFEDSSDSQDNAVFAAANVTITDLPDPPGFQHPAQVAYIAYGGFDAVMINVHLSWTDETRRDQEKLLLGEVVKEALQKDPDVIVVGDFNTTEPAITDLGAAIGLQVMVPEGQDGIGTTHAGNRYDHFLISPDLASEEAVSVRIVTFSGDDLAMAKAVSDHLPVVALFRTDQKFRDRP